MRGVGRAMFAAILLFIGGVLNIIWGIAAIGNSHFFVGNAHYVFGDLKTWGWIALILGVFEIFGGLSLFRAGTYGRWLAMIAGSLAAIDALLAIPAYPFWALAVFALSLWIVYGVAIYGEPEA